MAIQIRVEETDGSDSVYYQFPSEDGYWGTTAYAREASASQRHDVPPPDSSGDVWPNNIFVRGGIEALALSNTYSGTMTKRPLSHGAVPTTDRLFLSGKTINIKGQIVVSEFKTKIPGGSEKTMYQDSIALINVVAEMERRLRYAISQDNYRLYLEQFAQYPVGTYYTDTDDRFMWFYRLKDARIASFDVEYLSHKAADIDITLELSDPTLYNTRIMLFHKFESFTIGTAKTVSVIPQADSTETRFDTYATIPSPANIIIRPTSGKIIQMKFTNRSDYRNAIITTTNVGGIDRARNDWIEIDTQLGTFGYYSQSNPSADVAANKIEWYSGHFMEISPGTNNFAINITQGALDEGETQIRLDLQFRWRKRRL